MNVDSAPLGRRKAASLNEPRAWVPWLLKRLVPRAIRRAYLRPAVDALLLGADKRRWRAARRDIAESCPGTRRQRPRVMIITMDLHELVGSLGDDAMLTAAVAAVRTVLPHADIYVATASEKAAGIVRARGLTAIPDWGSGRFVEMCLGILARDRFDAVLVLGADALDGAYGVLNPGRALIFCDLAARTGIPVALLGFSFGRRPAAALRELFRAVHPSILFNLRDAMSLRRFQTFSSKHGRLVADVGFGLVPDRGEADLADAEQWIARRRAAGELVLGFNIHPMLFSPNDDAQLRSLLEASAAMLLRTCGDHPVSWLLVPHDLRPGVGDEPCLKRLRDSVAPLLGDRTHLLTSGRAAATVKRLVGRLDGTISGRMHLVIASLGMGVPAMGFEYQDKLEGLLSQFDLPPTVMMTPRQACDATKLSERVAAFISNLPQLRDQIARRRDEVIAMAALNFDILHNLGHAAPDR